MLTGCSLKKNTILPEQIVSKTLNEKSDSRPYYAEGDIKEYEDDKVTETIDYKEWNDESDKYPKRRLEMVSNKEGKIISTNYHNQLILYMEKSNKVMKIDSIKSNDNNAKSYKDQFVDQLGLVIKDHDIKLIGEEVVNGFKTYHIKALPKKKNSIIGEVNYWIEKDNCFVVKCTSENGNIKTETEYKKCEFRQPFEDKIFVLTLPKDVQFIDTKENKDTDLSLSEAEKVAGKPILHMPDNSEYKLKSIKKFEVSEVNHLEINLTYDKNGIDALMLTVIVNKNKVNSDISLPDEKKVKLRGTEALEMDGDIKTISWSEDGLNYSILIQDQTVDISCGEKIVENLVK